MFVGASNPCPLSLALLLYILYFHNYPQSSAYFQGTTGGSAGGWTAYGQAAIERHTPPVLVDHEDQAYIFIRRFMYTYLCIYICVGVRVLRISVHMCMCTCSYVCFYAYLCVYEFTYL